MFRRLFLDHPAAMGETWAEHRSVALWFAFQLIGAGLACLVHALVPALFVSTGSRTITRLGQRMASGRRGATATFPGYYSI